MYDPVSKDWEILVLADCYYLITGCDIHGNRPSLGHPSPESKLSERCPELYVRDSVLIRRVEPETSSGLRRVVEWVRTDVTGFSLCSNRRCVTIS